MNEKFRKEIIALYEEVMKKTCSNDRKKDISTLLYSNSVNDELVNYYLPERIKQKIMAIKVMNMLKE